ncbi:gamma-butyrobetaine hydroxylase-like domain-containing protein [Burkholderia pyrrocinia]|uniref:gamma-butyrobetaine hydroxylase-like domain-containing protein n=1 Tax=Burkholderia pyrrocinia TaxID=60550 RepID=UPI002AB21AE7|nr:gamma-butyrobetaine hydroxylase-like domain-containing protein [Burkholderia pyrrocinia]
MTPPTEIALDQSAHALTLRWPGGAMQRIGYAQLRSDCPCAACRKIRLDGSVVDVKPDLALDGVEPAGYGIRLLFGDGHARGIYPWPYLAELGKRETDANIAAHCTHTSGDLAG